MSYTRFMETKNEQKQTFTKAASALAERKQNDCKVLITAREAVEYREYKRQKKRAEIMAAISASEGVLTDSDDGKHISDRAVRLRQAAVRLNVERLVQTGDIFLQNGVPTDCVVGGDGETLPSVKAYEAKRAARLRAKEITLQLSPYMVSNCRYTELKKELKKIRRAVSKLTLKVSVDKAYPNATLSRIARLCCEVGAQYFCVPYFENCERVRIDLTGGCKLQVSGVETLEDFKRLANAGVGRIVTDRAWEIYTEWMREVEKINFPELMTPPESAAKRGLEELSSVKSEEKNPVLAALEKKAETKALTSAAAPAEGEGKTPSAEGKTERSAILQKEEKTELKII